MINNPFLPGMSQQQVPGGSPKTFMNQYDQGMLSNLLSQYPGLRQVYNENNFKTFNPTPERQQELKKIIGDEPRQSEFYFPNDPGGGDMLPHPAPGNYALEYYTKDSQQNPFVRKALTLGEMLHGMPQNQAWSGLRNQFFNQFSPEMTQKLQSAFQKGAFGNEGGKETYPQAMNRTIGDAFLRASFFQNPDSTQGLHPPAYAPQGDYWNNGEWLKGYSPAQQNTVNQMKQYLETGTRKYIPEDY
jgi:hypothetical protein